MNDWEVEVLDKEMGRAGAVAWYRNPARASQESLGVAYKDGNGAWRSMHPDFAFFNDHAGEIRVSIVDPHSHHLADAVPKLRGLARFAVDYGDEFHRIEAISRLGDQTKVLDMKDEAVRAAVLTAGDAKALHSSHTAGNY